MSTTSGPPDVVHTDLPRISFVVPVRNEAQAIKACLASLAAQDYPRDRFEILVVDGESTDRTRELVKCVVARQPCLQLRLLRNPEQTVAPGRNVGIRAATGEIIAFVEGHAVLPPDFLQEVAACFARADARCLGRYVEQLLPEGTAFQRATGLARKSVLGRNPHSGRFVEREACWLSPLGVATVYRREVFAEFGLYDESLDTNEDVELNYRLERAGLRAWYSPRLRYQLQPRDRTLRLLRQMYRYGVGKCRFVRRHPEARRLAYLAPTLLCLCALAALALAPFSPAASWVALPVAAYVALALVTGVSALRYGVWVALLVPAVMAMIVVGFGLGYGVEALRGLLSHAPRVPQADPHPRLEQS
jgi:glycosyltransferase involved in cell wall biosynthesis